jgi:starch phosphorylase
MSPHDQYLLLGDLESYLACQQQVNDVFLDQHRWTKMAIYNVARMGKFSTDRTIREYATDIWGIKV